MRINKFTLDVSDLRSELWDLSAVEKYPYFDIIFLFNSEG
jgi:hypothetical protein